MSRDAIGLDIGGANIKVATASGRADSIPFELWRHPERMVGELGRIREQWPDLPTVGVTMTGELCDCFPTKRAGVRHILAAVQTAYPDRRIGVWSTAGQFMAPGAAEEDYLDVAAANWHALATYAGREMPAGLGLLIDTGSTTTDIIPLLNGGPVPAALTDPARLSSGELVYSGVRRTPVCAILGPEVAAEWFATAHDVYVRLGLLKEEPGNDSTADGRPMTNANAHARLSRMLGGDAEITPVAETLALADRAFAAQRRAIADGIRRVLTHRATRPSTVCVSGSGEFLARAAWNDVAPDYGVEEATVRSLAVELGTDRSEAACAFAVAVLAAETAECA